MAAEISTFESASYTSPTRFNEAAANGRGNRGHRGEPDGHHLAASMRPRRMAAEIEPH